MHRGLVNYSGELWYREGLPSDVFRRLVVRKENETPLDRFSGDYEELMTYANFRDLADIIVGNDMLKDRLTVLEPRDGVSLLDRLHELEEMRRRITGGRKASDEDAARLERYFDEFRTAIKRGKSAPADTERSSSDRPERPSVPPEEETLDSIFGDDSPTPTTATSRPGRLVVKVSADNLRSAAGDSGSQPDPTPEPTPTPEPAPADTVAADPTSVASEVGSAETPVTDVSTRTGPPDREAKGPVEAAEDVERAVRDDDHAAILKRLHIEVTEIADGMLRRDPKHGHVVWETVNRRGWFAEHEAALELERLEEFYDLADRFLDSFSSGARSSELKEMLADAGFSKMLLGLREMFLTSRAKV